MDVQFYRTTVDGELQQTTARFWTAPSVLSDVTAIDIDDVAREFTSAVENFNKRGVKLDCGFSCRFPNHPVPVPSDARLDFHSDH